jgi:hypothetical protein
MCSLSAGATQVSARFAVAGAYGGIRDPPDFQQFCACGAVSAEEPAVERHGLVTSVASAPGMGAAP